MSYVQIGKGSVFENLKLSTLIIDKDIAGYSGVN